MAAAEEQSSLAEAAFRGIKRLMLQQKLLPGQRLVYRELIDLLGMSKTPILNALNRLEQEGFVSSRVNYGYIFQPMDAKEISDSFEVREALESKAVQRAIQKATRAQFSDLEEKYRAYTEYSTQVFDKKMQLLDAEFHHQIAAISGNEVLSYLLKRNFEHIILRINLGSWDPKMVKSSVRLNKALLEAMKKKDISGAVKLVGEQIEIYRDCAIGSITTTEPEELGDLSFFS